MNKIKIPSVLKKMNELFNAHGFESYLVGGAVRDVILGKEASDWDVTTNATPQDVMKIFHKVIPTGIDHGTVTVHLFGEEIEVTTFRCENGYSDGRHPDSITYTSDINDDLSRRDLTINAIAANLRDGSIVDPFDGRGDIKRKIIRTVGNPYDRFMEDGLRPVRALRFSSQLGFKIDGPTFNAISNPDVQKKIMSISVERFRDELNKMLKSDEPSQGFLNMEKTGILKLFIPELADCRGCTQADARGFHEYDVFDHNVFACDGAPKDNLPVRLAALFHDLGKLDAREVVTDHGLEIIHFHMHEMYSAKKVRKIMTRLKYSNAEIDKVEHLVKEHMFYYEQGWSDAAVRRFVVRVGLENVNDLFDLRLADIYGMHRVKIDPSSQTVHLLNELSDRIKDVERQNNALSLKDLAVNGNDLMNAGIPRGPELGRILNELFNCVIEDPGMNNKEQLINVARNIASK